MNLGTNIKNRYVEATAYNETVAKALYFRENTVKIDLHLKKDGVGLESGIYI